MEEIEINEAEEKGLIALTQILIPGTVTTCPAKLEVLGSEELPNATHYTFLMTQYGMKEVKVPHKLKPFGITFYKTEKKEEIVSSYQLWSDNKEMSEKFDLNPSKSKKVVIN